MWSKLAWAYLDAKQIDQSINCYIKANDSGNYHQVVNEAILAQKFSEVIPYIQMVKQAKKDAFLDTELAYAFCKTNKLNDLEFFLGQAQNTDIKTVGQRCLD